MLPSLLSSYYPLDSDIGIPNSTQTGLQDSETGTLKPTKHPQDSDIGISNCIHHTRNCGQQDSEKGIPDLSPQMEKFLKTPACVHQQDFEKGILELIHNIRNFGLQDSETGTSKPISYSNSNRYINTPGLEYQQDSEIGTPEHL